MSLDNEQQTEDISLLSERITAQTKAYVDFSNALVKIIEIVAEQRDKSKDIEDVLITEFRLLDSKFINHKNDMDKQFGNLEEKLSIFKKEMEGQNASLQLILNKFNTKHQGVSTFLTKVYSFTGALLLVGTLFALLTALSVIHISWFPK